MRMLSTTACLPCRTLCSSSLSSFSSRQSIPPAKIRRLSPSRTIRLFSGSLPRSSSSIPPPSKDPSHPNLYYHTFPDPPPGRIALSFLPHRPIPNSRTILGHLPLRGGTGLADFKENSACMQLINSSIIDGLRKGVADTVQYEAESRPGDGYIHITDERAVPPAGRIGETEDLIGTVFVQDNKIVAETYEPLPSYRLVSSNGPMILPKGLDRHVLEALEKVHKEEIGGS